MKEYTKDESILSNLNRDTARSVVVVVERGKERQDINMLGFNSLAGFDKWVDSQPATPNIISLKAQI
jgi:hypothetical protein